ncbi:MAG: hypothetical protein ACRDXB_15600, partial [Actinomycetes bacterium]
SDAPLADIVESLFLERGVQLSLTRPDFGLLPKVEKDVASRLDAGARMLGGTVDVVVAHRDADGAGWHARRQEIETAAEKCRVGRLVVPVIPVRMTEAWLLLDEAAIRSVAGNPSGRVALDLPKVHETERLADPKTALREALTCAASVTGRRRDRLSRRFSESRRQLMERLDPRGPVTKLRSWQDLVDAVDAAVAAHTEGDAQPTRSWT